MTSGPPPCPPGQAGAPGSPAARLLRVIAAAASAGGLILAGWLPCPSAFWLKIPCPGCGMTRATLCLLRGDLGCMWKFHPLAPLILLFLGAYFAVNGWGYVLAGRWGLFDQRLGRRFDAALWAFLGLVLGVWLLRFARVVGAPAPV